MRAFAELCEAVAATSKRTEKTRRIASFFRENALEDAAVAAIFLTGRAFPVHEETTLDVGGTLLFRAVLAVTGASEEALAAAYRRHGDLGAAAADLLRDARDVVDEDERSHGDGRLALRDVEARLHAIAAARGQAAKAALVRALLEAAEPVEAKYAIKIITSDLRIGSKESLVEEAIAQAFGAPVHAVQRANMLLGDVGETLRLSASGRLGEAKMRLFHPIAVMLASPAEDAEEAFSSFERALVEDKYDGIRAQAHVGRGSVRIFSRTRDDVTAAFPELLPELASLAGEVILDGEIVAWRDGRALRFSELQKRLGRKKVPEALAREVPVAFIAFDVLYAGGELVLDRPLAERAAILDRVLSTRGTASREAPRGQLTLGFDAPKPPEPRRTSVIRSPSHRADSAAGLDALFEEAQARGNEGLMVKDLASPYAPGRRGKSWLKLKRELATLDVVVTAVEHGHGKRAAVLSDYTFAVRDGDRLLNVGKAYSGLTDVEIAELTRWFREHTVEDRGYLRLVEPTLVIEVAFNAVMRSDRHESGFALRFPRIVRIRSDKSPDEIDTLDAVQAIFDRQGTSRGEEPAA